MCCLFRGLLCRFVLVSLETRICTVLRGYEGPSVGGPPPCAAPPTPTVRRSGGGRGGRSVGARTSVPHAFFSAAADSTPPPAPDTGFSVSAVVTPSTAGAAANALRRPLAPTSTSAGGRVAAVSRPGGQVVPSTCKTHKTCPNGRRAAPPPATAERRGHPLLDAAHDGMEAAATVMRDCATRWRSSCSTARRCPPLWARPTDGTARHRCCCLAPPRRLSPRASPSGSTRSR